MSLPLSLESFARIATTVEIGNGPFRVALVELPPDAPRSPAWWTSSTPLEQTPTLVLLGQGRHRIGRPISAVRLRMESVQWTVDVAADGGVVVVGDFFTNPTDIVRASIPWDVDDRRFGGAHVNSERLLHPNDRARAGHPTRGAITLADGDVLVHPYSSWVVRVW